MLRILLHIKLAELGQTISLYSSNRREEAEAAVLSDLGLLSMRRIDNLIADMEQEETSLEFSQTVALRRIIRVTITFVYLACILGGLSLTALAYFISFEMNLREKYLDELWRREESFRVTVDSIGDAVICTDPHGNVTLLNPVAERMTGWSKQDVNGRPVVEVFRIVDSETRETIVNPMEAAVKLNRIEHLPPNCILIRRDGHESFIADSSAPIHNREGEITGSVIVFHDMSASRAMTEQILHASQHDFLTGLPNRLLLTDRLGQAIGFAKRHMGQVAVLFLDLDGFKHINDSLGHLIGDKLLQSVALRLQAHVRIPDTVSRQGGDEFVLLLQELKGPEDAANKVRRVLQAISEAHSIDSHNLYVTASVGIRTGTITGAEALLRWMHPTRGCVPPLEFIRVAEDSGLILLIGAWVLREACAQARTWVDQGRPITTVAVNVSAVQFRDEHFLEVIFGTLGETGLDPGNLELELTESLLMRQPELAVSILEKLRDRGVAVSVDDFGTGYSSLSYLKKLPLDILKIDRSFIHQLNKNPDSAAIVNAIISMGQSLNLRIIAEGVETTEDLAFLKAHGCQEAQGFYFSCPVPAEQLAQMLNERSLHTIPELI